MEVYLNSIHGIDDAMVSMLMSKRSWSREKELDIRALCERVTDRNGFPNWTLADPKTSLSSTTSLIFWSNGGRSTQRFFAS